MTPREDSSYSHGPAERLPRFSLERRITVLVLLVTAVVLGSVAATSIPLELIPDGFSDPNLRIVVPWRDAPPREVLDKLVDPLEEELGSVKGLDRITSLSSVGQARLYLRFKANTDMDVAYREVRDRIERARRLFPDDADRVYTFKDDVSGIPVMVLGVAVDPSVADYYNLLKKRIMLPLERVDGVASVQANGLEEKEILIELDRDRTAASGLNIYQLAQDLGGDSFTLASGHVREGNKKLLLRSVARYEDIEALRNRLLTGSIRLKDVATVTYAEPDKNYRVRAMSRPAYAVLVMKEGDANARDVAHRLRKVFDEIQSDPRVAQSVEMIELWNEGDVIEESLFTLLKSGAIGAIIAAFVLFFFLRRLRVTMVVNLAVPLSLLLALTVMYFAGETLNILTLLALMVCVGLLVDNSVVVAENIDRLHKLGKSRREAAISGAGEIGLAITMSTLTTVIVFVPILLVEGQGQFFLLRMAIPICVALVASLLVALVYIPLGVMITLPAEDKVQSDSDRRGWYAAFTAMLGRAYDWTFELMNHFYGKVLRFALGHRFDGSIAVFVLFAGTIAATAISGRYKIVDVQENEAAGFEIDVTLPDSYTLEETEQWFLAAEKVVEDHKDELGLEGWFLFHTKTYGELQGWFQTPRTTNLTPREVTERVVELVPKPPGIELSTGEESPTDEADAQKSWQITLNGEDATILEDVAKSLEGVFLKADGVLGIRRDSERSPNELALVIDRDRTQHFGIDPRAVAYVVGYALRGQALPKYRDEGTEVPVRVRFQESDRENLDQLAAFGLPTAAGNMLPLSAVTDVEMLRSRDTIVRRDKRIARSITLDLIEGEEEDTRERLNHLAAAVNLPEGVSFSRGVAAQGMNEDQREMTFALLLAVIFIYLLMGLLFESFVLPLSIVVTIPLAFIGVCWIHIIFRLNIDFLGLVGTLLLVGVVVNNGIVLVDYVNRLRAGGMARTEAILVAADRRFRPIMMTALTTVGGMIPLAISGRMDSGISYTSFAMTLIGGMTTATFLTLLVVPVLYTLFDDLRIRVDSATHGALRWKRPPRASLARSN